jgi:hypothetical protein
MERLTSLPEGHIFVFGSNTEGNHAGGAAADAVRYFRAVEGRAAGLQGQSYGIPTVDYTRPGDYKLRLGEIRTHVLDFLRFASRRPELTFHVTPIGCGIAGYEVRQIAPLFREGAEPPSNIVWPEEFVEFWSRA